MNVIGLAALALAAACTPGPVTVLVVGARIFTAPTGVEPVLPLKNSRMSGAVLAAAGKFDVVPRAVSMVRSTLCWWYVVVDLYPAFTCGPIIATRIRPPQPVRTVALQRVSVPRSASSAQMISTPSPPGWNGGE